MKIKENWRYIICFVLAGISIYMTFVSVIPIERLGNTMSAYFWILMAMTFYIMDKVSKIGEGK